MTVAKLSARDLMRSAYENRYTWDKGFPGYTADVTYKYGEKTVTGKVKVNSNLKAEVFDIEDEEANKVVSNQLWEIAIHRIRREFESTHGENTFALGETDNTGAVEVLVGGKSDGDKYKVRNNEVCMVHRKIHGVIVTINTFSSHDTGAGYLSHRYDSVYQDVNTGERKGGRNVFEDEYEKVGDYFILNRRAITTEENDNASTQEIIFSNFELLG